MYLQKTHEGQRLGSLQCTNEFCLNFRLGRKQAEYLLD